MALLAAIDRNNYNRVFEKITKKDLIPADFGETRQNYRLR
jgi:hypothetical protein